MANCPLTNHEVILRQDISGDRRYIYENPVLGIIRINDVGFRALSTLTDKEKDIVKGLVRNAQEEQGLIITEDLLNRLDNLDIPYDFDGKTRYLLKYLYDHGGREYKNFNLNSAVDNALVYSSREEFENIVRGLKQEQLIYYKKAEQTKDRIFYLELGLTKEGIRSIEQGLRKMPLFGLVNQEITTGNFEVDSKINHARELFFDEHPTIEKMRSACETLIFVMEPLRKELENIFKGDTDYFFRIVNEFSIRHNKERTRSIETSEQLEWLFYSLLNTINTYVKMKSRMA